MKKINYNTSSELAEKLIEHLSLLDSSYPTICVFGHYDVIKEILEELIREGVSIGFEIELEDYENKYYDKEFVLYLSEDGISVEKKWHEENEYHGAKYFDSHCDVAFIHEDCNSRILKHIKADLMIEFNIDEDECDVQLDSNESESTYISRDKSGKILGFSKSWSTLDGGVHRYSSYSHYSDNFDDMKKLAKDFGVEL